MTTLPHPSAVTAVLSFDFDGTLHDPAEEPPVPREFFDLIRKLRDEQGVVWGINTGRSMPQMIEGFIESRKGAAAKQPSRVLALDGITNSQNVGMIVRSAVATDEPPYFCTTRAIEAS